jgi:hypothetical protein
MYSEIDDARWEHRKVEVYADGRHDFADVADARSSEKLSKEPAVVRLQAALKRESALR